MKEWMCKCVYFLRESVCVYFSRYYIPYEREAIILWQPVFTVTISFRSIGVWVKRMTEWMKTIFSASFYKSAHEMNEKLQIAFMIHHFSLQNLLLDFCVDVFENIFISSINNILMIIFYRKCEIDIIWILISNIFGSFTDFEILCFLVSLNFLFVRLKWI